MARFLSTFVNKVDKKGRVSVPATFRAALTAEGGSRIYCYRALSGPVIEGCGESVMEALSATVDPLDPIPQVTNKNYAILVDTRELSWDAEGRVVLPEDLITHAEITDTAAFVGVGPKFQIWRPETLREVTEAARARALESLRQPGGGA